MPNVRSGPISCSAGMARVAVNEASQASQWERGMEVTIRVAKAEDASLLPEIERSAAARFRSMADLAWIADSEPTPGEVYLPMIAAGTVWVAEDPKGSLEGFLAAEQADAELHIWEVNVLSQHQGRGIGRRLIEAARAYTEAAGLSALTLTTFRDVPWNSPFYARLGFEMLPTSSVGPRLGSILEREAGLGLPRERRCAMWNSVTRQGSS